jgi:nucleoside-diphosphate-sugar epimerase
MSRAKEDLGYAPVYTRAQGLDELAAWIREHKSAA